jgi:hypothetical protein
MARRGETAQLEVHEVVVRAAAVVIALLAAAGCAARGEARVARETHGEFRWTERYTYDRAALVPDDRGWTVELTQYRRRRSAFAGVFMVRDGARLVEGRFSAAR